MFSLNVSARGGGTPNSNAQDIGHFHSLSDFSLRYNHFFGLLVLVSAEHQNNSVELTVHQESLHRSYIAPRLPC